ncbi:TonB-dependent receptor [Prevotella cerevisiae]|uniref:TonB-dependent receptor n=1 Tax=Segatella cerevisiae TaxID=2053716 RepID=A0ABT1BUF7_9BACT|nr:TonB-dependent receptor [Segatella cerevisiae]MCO6024726.1 TonB-dependent receptor [Segatella cerevisiae]
MNYQSIMAAALFAATALPLQVMGKGGPSTDLSDSSRVHDLDEVVVIRQPKEFLRLRQQSLSSTVMTYKEMYALGVRDLRDLSSYIPSFVMPDYGSRYTSSIYVRGIGSRINSPAVALYMDGMPIISKAAFNFHTYQLDRVDILRGPQGTLYGQNSEGGLVRMYSKNPLYYQGTDIDLGIGSRLYRNTEFAHYQKLNDRLGMSIAGFYDGQNGFFKNQTTGKRADLFNEAGGRLRLVYQPSNRLNLDYTADYQYVNQNGFPYGVMDLESGKTAAPAANRQSTYRRNMLNTGLTVTYKANRFDFNSTSSYQYLRDNMFMDQDYLPQDFMHLQQKQLQNALTQEFNFKSNRPVGGFWNWTVGTFFSSEWLRTDGPVYFDKDMTTPIATAIQQQMYSAIVGAMAAQMIQKGMPQAAAQAAAQKVVDGAGGVSLGVEMGAPGVYHTPQYNLGLFHESSFDITDRLTGTIGLRYDFTHTKIHYQTSAYMSMSADVMGTKATNLLSTILDGKTDDDYNQLLPKFGLNYRIDEQGSNVYATVSKGYRAGGYNFQMFSDILSAELNANAANARSGDYVIPHTDADYQRIAKTISFRPETSWNYEAGTHLNLFDHSVQFDFSAFFMQIRNQQLSVMANKYGYGRMMVNAGKSYSCGIEASLRGVSFNNHLDWAVTYGLTHAAFKNYQDSIEEDGVEKLVDYKDKKVPYVPMNTFSARADYRFDVSAGCLKAIILGANVYGQGKTYWDELNTYYQKIYAVLGAHIDADWGFMKLSFWGRNLTDTKYNTFSFQSSASGQNLTFAQRGNGIQYGVDLKFHF